MSEEPHWSEADELEKLLGMLDTDAATLQLGIVLGIMRKGDAVHIARLEEEIVGLKATVEAMTDFLDGRAETNGGKD